MNTLSLAVLNLVFTLENIDCDALMHFIIYDFLPYFYPIRVRLELRLDQS